MKKVLGLVAVAQVVAVVGSSTLLAADLKRGHDIYAARCASCHAKDLKGNPAMAKMYKLDPSALNLVGKEAQAKSDQDLITITTKGKGKMPAQEGKLEPAVIADVIAYVRSQANSGEKAK